MQVGRVSGYQSLAYASAALYCINESVMCESSEIILWCLGLICSVRSTLDRYCISF